MRLNLRKSRYRLGKNFVSCFEEKKALKYLQNLIASKLLTSKTAEIFCFAIAVLGKRNLFGLIRKNYPEIAKLDSFKEALLESEEYIAHVMPIQSMKTLLKKKVLPSVSKRLNALSTFHDADLDIRFSMLQKTFNLTVIFQERSPT